VGAVLLEQLAGPWATLAAVSGSEVNYCCICPRKLWFFSHNIEMEHTSDRVREGRIIHEQSYRKRSRYPEPIGEGLPDYRDSAGLVYEVKLSRKMEYAHVMQLLYYLYLLSARGIESEGVIEYPLIRRRVRVRLTQQNRARLQKLLERIIQIKKAEVPPKAKRSKKCGLCSYRDLCWC